MTDPEREIILKMIEEGKITPEEGLKLMSALQAPAGEDARAAGAEEGAEAGETSQAEAGASGEWSSLEAGPRIAGVKNAARRLWQIPLWLGVLVTVLSAWGMYALVQVSAFNFWFYCLIVPLLLGVVAIAAAVGSRKARWIFVDVRQKPGEKPSRIFLGFPLPLKFTAWALRTFGHKIPDLQETSVDEVIQVVESGLSSDEPLIVHVDEGEEGERVQVYIG